jgi:hypothetical protein
VKVAALVQNPIETRHMCCHIFRLCYSGYYHNHGIIVCRVLVVIQPHHKTHRSIRASTSILTPFTLSRGAYTYSSTPRKDFESFSDDFTYDMCLYIHPYHLRIPTSEPPASLIISAARIEERDVNSVNSICGFETSGGESHYTRNLGGMLYSK